MLSMKAALLIESLTGNTWKAGERIAGLFQQEGWTITGLDRVRRPNYAAVQDADLVVVGTWVHGLFVVAQAPWGLGAIGKLPMMRGKQAAVFCTYALNPGSSVGKLNDQVLRRGADSLGGLALHRAKLDEHCETFVRRVLENASAPAPSALSAAR